MREWVYNPHAPVLPRKPRRQTGRTLPQRGILLRASSVHFSVSGKRPGSGQGLHYRSIRAPGGGAKTRRALGSGHARYAARAQFADVGLLLGGRPSGKESGKSCGVRNPRSYVARTQSVRRIRRSQVAGWPISFIFPSKSAGAKGRNHGAS